MRSVTYDGFLCLLKINCDCPEGAYSNKNKMTSLIWLKSLLRPWFRHCPGFKPKNSYEVTALQFEFSNQVPQFLFLGKRCPRMKEAQPSPPKFPYLCGPLF